ncbi:MAG TPA: hypothetical protein VFZ65_10340 [Planctomycetota bacterium]|nr:hypothetical protein [Planctomycetota bacterium]
MRYKSGVLLTALAFALPAAAQTEGTPAKPAQDVTKLWKVEATGIGG